MALNFQQSGSATFRRLLLVVLLAVSLVLVTLYSREGEDGPLHSIQQAVQSVVAPFKFVGAAANAGLSSVGEDIENLTADDATLSELREYNEQLIKKYTEMEEYRLEAERLQEMLNLKDAYDIDGVTGRVIGKNIEAWNQVITIDVGSDDDVNSGMTVMGNSGVIEKIKSTTPKTSEVRLLTDSQAGAAALVQSSQAAGIVRGSLEGLLYLENVDEGSLPVLGDVVVTSGLGGSYTRGLIIGTVVRVDGGKGDATGRIVIEPNDHAQSLSEVMVVKGLNSASSDNTAANGGE